MYCTRDEVKSQLPPNIKTEDNIEDSFTTGTNINATTLLEIDAFIEISTDIINGVLAPLYDTPLVKCNLGREINYPSPIPYICALLSATLLYNKILQGTDSKYSDSMQTKQKQAYAMLEEIKTGNITLKNQNNTRGSRFVHMSLFNAPFNPALKESKLNQ